MSAGQIELEHRGSVAWITISNPQKRNAMSLRMWQQLAAVLADVNDDTRCIVLRGAGEKAFVAGADISEFEALRSSQQSMQTYDEAAEAAMQRLQSMPQPTVAMISGYCVGGGVALALCCDVRLATNNSQYAVPAARLGLGYGATGLKKLLDVVSVPVAMDIMISARRYSATEALSMGLVNRIYPPETLAAEVENYASAISRNAPLTIRAAKQAINELSKMRPDIDWGRCQQFVDQCFASEDYREGTRAFMEKREPRFQGR